MKLTPIQKTCFTFNFPNIVQGPGRSFWLIVFLSLLSFHFPVQDAAAQTGQTPVKVTGTVTDHAGEPLPGVSIVIKGTMTGTITDGNGSYMLPSVPDDGTLVFSFVGMKPQEVAVQGRTVINITMEEETIGLEEVVAVGYGTQKKVNLTGAVSQVDSKVLESRPITNLGQGLQGVIANLNIDPVSGAPGRGVTFNIRGTTSINSFTWNEQVVPSSGGGWAKSDWSDIRSCNYFLNRYTSVEGEESGIRQYVAEIRFFKAWYYHEKVKQFGDVPWLSADLQVDSDELMAPRDSRKLVMDSVVVDLDYAAANLPESSSDGRLTRYAALALKARACLFEGTFRKYHNLGDYETMLREAANAAEAIITSGRFSLYSTGDPDNDFYNLFIQDDLSGNSEGIMIQNFIEDKKMHNRVRELGEAGSGLTKDFAETYLCTDGKPVSLSTLYRGDTQFEDEFINRDPRMQQTIYTRDRPYHITASGEYQYQDVPQFDNGMCYTGYRIIKFFSPNNWLVALRLDG